MSNPTGPAGAIVHEVRWSDALPWWILFRAAGAAFSPTVILLAGLGSLALWAGGSAARQLGLDAVGPGGADSLVFASADSAPPAGDDALVPSRDRLPWLHGLLERLPAPLPRALEMLTIPFRPQARPTEIAAAAARIGWFVLVWAIFGTAICRHVALKLAGEEPPGLFGSIAFGSGKWPPAFNSVLFVLVGIAAASIPGCLLGLAMRSEWGLAVAGAIWPLVLLGAVVLAILVVGVIAGWPLMVASIGVERGDSFQAISTAFSYVYQRPLHYAFYALVAAVVAVPALAAAGLFADAIGGLAMWATSFGMGSGRTAVVLEGLGGAGPVADAWGMEALRFWTNCLRGLLGSFGWGYFWAIATAAYLVLRQDVDATPLDEVVIEEPGTAAA